ncbi:heme-binding protein [Dyadobacter sp. 3J3]|uniref:GlcG/HbpS family heme-binding protein n=1 Tax=Dyadobacter sp. 3J3 TaxID=2606600 RepID=UPI00135BBC2C|nr:heme-binding protein [Dyadobacter sp. 3J3]
MKLTLTILILLMSVSLKAQIVDNQTVNDHHREQSKQYLIPQHQLSFHAAEGLAARARVCANQLGRSVSIAILDGSGQIILISRQDGVGPHNTEAARRKAYTSVSTKTPTLSLSRNAKSNPDTENLAHLPELLLLGGGSPIWFEGKVIGAIGVAGGGSPENDDLIAKSANIEEAGITTQNN